MTGDISSVILKEWSNHCGNSLGSSGLAAIGTTLRGVAQFGRALALGASGRRFKSFHPDCIHTTTMHFYSVEYWQENWETLMERVENGETIGVENDNGERAVMVPADDELIRLYTDHNEGS